MKKYFLIGLPICVIGLALIDIIQSGVSKEAIIVIVCGSIMALIQMKSKVVNPITISAYIVFAIASVLHSNFVDVSSWGLTENTYIAFTLMAGFSSITTSLRDAMGG